MKTSGHFNTSDDSYVVTDPATPRAWINYRGQTQSMDLAREETEQHC
jgi:hypothetical protein